MPASSAAYDRSDGGAQHAPMTPINEAVRLAALRSYNILDTPPEPGFERLTKLAAQIFDVPIALVSLVEESRQWFKSARGLAACETPIEQSFCAHAIRAEGVMVVPDAMQDLRFAANPLVTGDPAIRFYAGAPLITADGVKLGTLCIIDTKPRPVLSEEQKETLADLASLAIDEMELRKHFGATLVGQAKALDDFAAHFEGLFHTCDLAVITTSPEGIVTGWNPAAACIFGWQHDEVVGRSLPLIHRADSEEQAYHRRLLVDREAIAGIELRRPRKDGSLVDLRVAVTPLTGAANEIVGILCLAEDVTDEKVAQRELVRAKEAAEAGNYAKSEFLANMSHELRTPLNAIIGFAEVIKAEMFGELGSPKYRDYVEDIRQAGTHLLEIINSILDLSRAEIGALALRDEEVDLASVIGSAVRIMRERMEQSGLTFHMEGPDTPIRLWADETRVRQMLLNLMSNAVKFTEPGGSITLHYGPTANDRCRISVRDTGIGIDPANLSRVLTPFSPGEKALSRSHEGAGLGLPLTDRFIRLHGGALTIDSAVGRGTTATLEFPPDRVLRN